MKRHLSMVLTICLVVIMVAGCAPAAPAPAPAPAPSAPASPSAPAPAPAPQAPAKAVVIKVGYENNPGEPVDIGCQTWAAKAKEYSNGGLEVQLFPSSQLGTKKDIIEQGMNGAASVTLGDGSFYMDFVPDTGIMAAPYIYDDESQVVKLLSSDWWKQQKELLKGKGLFVVTDNWKYGSRETIAKKAILSPDDFKGMKIRTPNNPLFTKAFEVMGATPTPMPLGDVYTALQQGVVDGAENPLPVIYGSKQHEVVKHVSLTSHIIMYTIWTGGTSYFDTLSDDLVNAFMKAGQEGGDACTAETNKQTTEVIEKFKSEGVTVHEVDTAPFAEKVKSIYSSFTQWTPNLYDTVKDSMK